MKVTLMELVLLGIALAGTDLLYLYIFPDTSISISDKIFGEVIALASLYLIKKT